MFAKTAADSFAALRNDNKKALRNDSTWWVILGHPRLWLLMLRWVGVAHATAGVARGDELWTYRRWQDDEYSIDSLKKYEIPFEASGSDDELRNALAKFHAKRTLTHIPIDPKDCAQAILFLAGPNTPCTTGHLIPVDGGLVEACLR